MDEEAIIIATMMAEEETRRLKKKDAEKRNKPLVDTYQAFQSDQPGGVFRPGWIIVATVILVIYLIFLN